MHAYRRPCQIPGDRRHRVLRRVAHDQLVVRTAEVRPNSGSSGVEVRCAWCGSRPPCGCGGAPAVPPWRRMAGPRDQPARVLRPQRMDGGRSASGTTAVSPVPVLADGTPLNLYGTAPTPGWMM